jgi:hypothetical protein
MNWSARLAKDVRAVRKAMAPSAKIAPKNMAVMLFARLDRSDCFMQTALDSGMAQDFGAP